MNEPIHTLIEVIRHILPGMLLSLECIFKDHKYGKYCVVAKDIWDEANELNIDASNPDLPQQWKKLCDDAMEMGCAIENNIG